ncbi:LysR family transcriptional regulator, partial [Arthrobacter deserti]|nr:LysR family transcriptional regulator [Arthrobacter deserti]
LLQPGTSSSEREKLWHSLGLRPSQRGVVLVFRERQPSDQLAQRISNADPACIAVTVGADAIAVAPDSAVLRRFTGMAAGIRAGIGGPAPVSHLHLSYARAVDALAFTDYGSPVSRIVSHGELGALALLARAPREELLSLPGLPAIAAIEKGDNGPAELEALEALCRSGTLRGAAKLLHLHHSSIAKRIGNVEKALGYRLTEPIPLCTAYATLLALRLLKAGGADAELGGQ